MKKLLLSFLLLTVFASISRARPMIKPRTNYICDGFGIHWQQPNTSQQRRERVKNYRNEKSNSISPIMRSSQRKNSLSQTSKTRTSATRSKQPLSNNRQNHNPSRQSRNNQPSPKDQAGWKTGHQHDWKNKVFDILWKGGKIIGYRDVRNNKNIYTLIILETKDGKEVTVKAPYGTRIGTIPRPGSGPQ